MQDQSGELLASKQKQKEVGRMKLFGPVDVNTVETLITWWTFSQLPVETCKLSFQE